ncbi:hypothetical protein IMZ29_09550 [Achromobacter sp. GG226]|uniref:hypothetical protein n=1 Tax=Verticiella alkaliphila TaxID=2779529 RepID=UPI001C0B03FE|nr:hypothetical protein [Verticiella sp. GG226]MBU4610765.1 hypothetical protein [Verticiella sp. GG226]
MSATPALASTTPLPGSGAERTAMAVRFAWAAGLVSILPDLFDALGFLLVGSRLGVPILDVPTLALIGRLIGAVASEAFLAVGFTGVIALALLKGRRIAHPITSVLVFALAFAMVRRAIDVGLITLMLSFLSSGWLPGQIITSIFLIVNVAFSAGIAVWLARGVGGTVAHREAQTTARAAGLAAGAWVLVSGLLLWRLFPQGDLVPDPAGGMGIGLTLAADVLPLLLIVGVAGLVVWRRTQVGTASTRP